MPRIQTFSDLRDEVLGWLDETDTSTLIASVTKDNAEAAIRQAHERRLLMDRWPFLLWPRVETISVSPAAGRFYTLHPLANRIESVYNPTAKVYLEEQPVRQIPELDLDTETNTRPNAFRLNGYWNVAAQPSTADTLTIVSSSASDTTAAKAIIIKGVVSGAYVEESLTPNGTSPVTSSNSFEYVLSVTKSAAWVGTMTLATTGGTTILQLGASEFARQYPVIELLTTPDAAHTINYRFYRHATPLENENDIPDIPAPYSNILVWDALLQFAAYNGDAEPQAVALWRDNQQNWEQALEANYLDGQTLNSAIRRVRHIDDEPSFRRVFPSS